MKKLKTLMMLGLVLTCGLVLTACGTVTSNGAWLTNKMGVSGNVTTYKFSENKAYGFDKKARNELTITKTVTADTEKVTKTYAISTLTVILPAEISGSILPVTDDNGTYNVKYTGVSGTVNYLTKSASDASSSISNNEFGRTNDAYKVIFTSVITGTESDQIDISKDLVVTFTYRVVGKVYADGASETFTFAFPLSKLNKEVK